MTIRTALEAAEVARTTTTNDEGMCQKWTRGYYLAPGAGDVDGDGDADALDGWLSEPAAARHPGDRNPPRGYPVSFASNNPTGHGHRAISFGNGLIRSTDFDTATKRYRAGVVGTGTIAQVEAAMGVHYLGWSETIDGVVIPKPAAKPEVVAPRFPTYLDLTMALANLADKSTNPAAKRLYLSARSVLGPLVSNSDRSLLPKTTAGVIAALKVKRDQSSSISTKARLTAAITLLRPVA